MDNLQAINHQSSRRRDLLRGINLIFKNPLTTFGLAIILVLMLTALFAPYVAPFPDQGRGQSNLGERLLPPSTRHPMGTDNLGRDIFSRIIFGSRISLQASVCVILLVVMFGAPLGLIAGYFGG
jgi:peptide/nickel transport system permease protein